MKQKGLAPIVIILLLTSAVLLIPLPYYQSPICLPGMGCPKPGWYLGDPLWKKVFNYFSSVNRPTNSGTTIIVPSPTPTSTNNSTTSAETANWKTYTNTKYRISFEYPPNLLVIDKSGETDNVFFAYSESEKQDLEKCLQQIECYSYSLNIEFRILSKPKNQSLIDVVKKDRHMDQLNMSPITIDHLSGLRDQSNGISTTDNIYLDKGDTVFHIFANAINNPEENIKIYSQILSTFKFLP